VNVVNTAGLRPESDGPRKRPKFDVWRPTILPVLINTGLSKKMEAIWNRYNLKSTGRIYTFGVLKCSGKFKVLDLL